MTVAIILIGAVAVAGLYAWMIYGAPTVHHQSELRSTKSRIAHDYKHLAATKQSSEFDAGALAGAGITLIIFSLLVAFLRHGSQS